MGIVEHIGIETAATIQLPKSKPDRFGNEQFGSATNITCQFIDEKIQNLSSTGQVTNADAQAIVKIDIPINSLFYLDSAPTEKYQVKETQKIPDIKGSSHRRILMLMRYKN